MLEARAAGNVLLRAATNVATVTAMIFRPIVPGAIVLALSGCNLGEFMAGGERWDVVTVDGAAASDMSVIVDDGRIIGGFDGCAKWSFKTNDSPIIVGDGARCAPTAERLAYLAIVRARRNVPYRGAGDAILEADGHRMMLRRAD